jgi:hypothetical protein
MRKSTDPLTPNQVYRYAVEAFQPHLKLGGTNRLSGNFFL